MNSESIQPEVFEFSLADLPSGIEGIFTRLQSLPFPIFLDGCPDAIRIGNLNRYSFLAADPVDSLVVKQGDSLDVHAIRNLIARYPGTQIEGLPPFQGGVAGLLSYEFNAAIEKIQPAKIDDFSIPLASLFVYDTVVAIDHDTQMGWIVSQGWSPEKLDRASFAKQRMKEFKDRIFSTSAPSIDREASQRIKPQSSMNRIDGDLELYSDFSKDEYLHMIRDAVEYIHAGDIFQVNLSQRLLTPATCSSPQLYLQMRTSNPAPFSGYLDFGDGQLISASPERLIHCHNNDLETRPIKGTRRRTNYPEVDLNVQTELIACEKDRAENIMIVDLMRNDLSKFSEPNSVRVGKLCDVERYQNVLHLVSVVNSKLDQDSDIVDVIGSVFPGGSITGAPKIRAMEIVSQLEPTTRGAYCGSLGYINCNGDADFNILIRSVTATGGWWHVPVGGGIVADSIPEKEYEETWTKAIGMLQAIRSVGRQRFSKIKDSVAVQ